MLTSKSDSNTNSTLIQLNTAFTQLARQIFQCLLVLFVLVIPLAWAQEPAADNDSSSASSAAAEKSQLPSQLDLINALAAELPKGEQLWLGEDDEQFISLYRPALNPAQMAIVLLAENENQLVHDPIPRQIYLDLPNQDWSTLSLLLPPANPSVIPTRKSPVDGISLSSGNPDQPARASAPITPTADENNNTDFDQLAGRRINLAIQHFTANGSRSVALFTTSGNASRAIKSAINNTDSTSGMILWKVSTKYLNVEELKTLMESRVTILDIVDASISKHDRTERHRLFKIAGFNVGYSLITAPSGNANAESISRRIRHWLDRNLAKR